MLRLHRGRCSFEIFRVRVTKKKTRFRPGLKFIDLLASTILARALILAR